MNTAFPKSAKRALSLVIAFAMLVGTLFVANVGVSIKTDAETATVDISDLKRVEYLSASSRTADSSLSGEGTAADPYKITNAAELWYVCTGVDGHANGKYYEVDPDIDAFVLQPESVIGDLGAFLALDAEGVKDFFADKTPTNWISNGYLAFNGNFNGNGVKIYGLYADAAIKKSQNAGLFPAVDGGAVYLDGDTRSSYETTRNGVDGTFNVYQDNTGIKIEDFAVSHAYLKSYQRAGVVFADANSSVWAANATATGSDNYLKGVDGVVNLNKIEVTGCYVDGVLEPTTDSNGNPTTKDHGVNAKGIMVGSCNSRDVLKASNCLVYGNVGYNIAKDETVSKLGLHGNLAADDKRTDITLTFNDMAVFDVEAGRSASNIHRQATCTNVYTDQGVYIEDQVITVPDMPSSLHAPLAMPNLKWADSTDDSDAVWYATRGEYPTVIKPDGWTFEESKLYDEGDGTKDIPYIIETPYQLWKTVTNTDKDVYYKVADGVDALYLSNSTTLDEVKAMKASGHYFNWFNAVDDTTTAFNGHLDGNGATVYGMISSGSNYSGYGRVGFVKSLGHNSTASISHLNFDSCYAYSTGNAAIVLTNVGGYNGYDSYATIQTVTVRNSYVETTNASWIETSLSNNAYETSLAGGAAGIAAPTATADMLTITNCLFDGYTCELISSGIKIGMAEQANGNYKWTEEEIAAFNVLFNTNYTENDRKNYTSITTNDNETYELGNMNAGIYSGSAGHNNVTVIDCISLGAPVMPQPNLPYSAFISTKYNDVAVKRVNLRYVDETNPGTSEYNNVNMIKFVNSVSTEEEHLETQVIKIVKKLQVYDESAIPVLNWLNWETTTVENDRVIPMPKASDTAEYILSFTDQIVEYNRFRPVGGVYSGKYGHWSELAGKGTESDPYIITNALQLAQAIACGGKDVSRPLYYKLGCDIEINGNWITNENKSYYKYVPFEGYLDGAGHLVSNFAAVDDVAAGLIPVLAGGTVKDLHIRDAYVGSAEVAGAIAGEVKGGTITGCSVETSSIAATKGTDVITGSTYTCTDSYYILDGVQTLSNDVDDSSLYPADNAVWYKNNTGIYRHVSFAQAHQFADVEGNGLAEDDYQPGDITALVHHLLGREGYENIYGDVNRNGEVNISDLAVIRRKMVGTYNTIKDGFWRNLEIGNIDIYYDQNDSYDMARKLELYLEAQLENVDINKMAHNDVEEQLYIDNDNGRYDTAPTQNAIVITKTNASITTVESGDYADYTVTFDSANNLLTITGGSFTAVEQAVLDLIEQINANGGYGCTITGFNGSILSNTATSGKYTWDTKLTDNRTQNGDEYKKYRWVDKNGDGIKTGDELYFYAWGDEFESDSTIDTTVWHLNEYRNETEATFDESGTKTETEDGANQNLESANAADTPNLWVVEDGKLTINRGYRTTDGTATGLPDGYVQALTDITNDGIKENGGTITNDFGSKIDTDDVWVDAGSVKTMYSMLFKYGYAEMRASLPSDGHAFPAWWFLTGPAFNSNSNIDATLYSKVYTKNQYYDGTSTGTFYGNNPATYKYQIPAAHLEFDIVELMQGITSTNYKDYFQATVHKIYTENVHGKGTSVKTDDILYLPNWDRWNTWNANDKIGEANYFTTWNTYDESGNYIAKGEYSFNTDTLTGTFISANGKPYLNNYNQKNYGDRYASPKVSVSGTASSITENYYITTTTTTIDWLVDKAVNASFSPAFSDYATKYDIHTGYTEKGTGTGTGYFNKPDVTIPATNIFSSFTYDKDWGESFSGKTGSFANAFTADHTALQRTYTYGFTWDADPDSDSYILRIFCDLDDDGQMEANEKIFEINQDTGYDDTWDEKDPVTAQSDNIGQTDADMWNQYAYMILDNSFYTSINGTKGSVYEDLAENSENKDKLTFDIEYVRVYQNDGKRDIVTPDTEAFNNDNHFNY